MILNWSLGRRMSKWWLKGSCRWGRCCMRSSSLKAPLALGSTSSSRMECSAIPDWMVSLSPSHRRYFADQVALLYLSGFSYLQFGSASSWWGSVTYTCLGVDVSTCVVWPRRTLSTWRLPSTTPSHRLSTILSCRHSSLTSTHRQTLPYGCISSPVSFFIGCFDIAVRLCLCCGFTQLDSLVIPSAYGARYRILSELMRRTHDIFLLQLNSQLRLVLNSSKYTHCFIQPATAAINLSIGK